MTFLNLFSFISHTQKKIPCDAAPEIKSIAKKNTGGCVPLHSGVKPFRCGQCQKSFVDEKGLKRHLLRHIGFKPFRCSQCDYAAVDQSNLSQHMRKHAEKSFQCSQCGKTFYKQGALDRHELTHGGEMPFKCKYCGSGYFREHHFVKHLKVHGIFNPESVINEMKNTGTVSKADSTSPNTLTDPSSNALPSTNWNSYPNTESGAFPTNSSALPSRDWVQFEQCIAEQGLGFISQHKI